MKTKLILISWVLFICLAAGPAFGAGKGGIPSGKPFIVLQDQIVEVEGAVSSLSDQIAELVEVAETMEGQIALNEAGMNSLTTESADLQAQIDANATDIDSLQATVDALEADNIILQAQIVDNGDADGALQLLIDANAALITANQMELAGLSTLQGQIDNNSTLISMLQTQVDSINDMVAMKQDILNGTCPNGQAVMEIDGATGSITCTPVTSPTGQIERLEVWAPGQLYWTPGNRIAHAFCPTGYTLSGGGHLQLLYYDNGSDVNYSYPSGNGWRVIITHWNLKASTFYAIANCIRIMP